MILSEEMPRGRKMSLLFDHKDKIFEMKKLGYSHRQIANWLKSEGVHVGASTVNRFVNK